MLVCGALVKHDNVAVEEVGGGLELQGLCPNGVRELFLCKVHVEMGLCCFAIVLVSGEDGTMCLSVAECGAW